MKIIKKPNIPVQKCSACGCEFKIKAKDIKTYLPTNALGFVEVTSNIAKVVYCPVCGQKNEVKFETPQNETL